jgi:hypothetical protein
MYGRGLGMGRGMGRGMGLGLGSGMGLGRNFSPYCRWYPGGSGGPWTNPGFGSQLPTSSIGMMDQPPFGVTPYSSPTYPMPHQYAPHTAFPQQAAFPFFTSQQYQTTLPQQLYYGQQMQYGLGAGGGMGMGMGGGMGMGMHYRRRMGQFGGGLY